MRSVLLLSALLLVAACDDPNPSTPDPTVADSLDVTSDLPSSPDSEDDGASDASSDADDDVTADASGPVDPHFEAPASQIAVRLADWGLTLTGRLYAAGSALDFHTEAAREGHCRLLTYEASLCEPGCDFQEACVNGVCMGYPAYASAGDLEIRGIPGAPHVVEPTSYGEYWFQTDAVTSADVDGALQVVAAGDVIGAFDLSVDPVAPVTPVGDWVALMQARAPGADVTLTWSDPDPGSRIYMRMTTGIGTHGGVSPAEVECEAPDTGSLTLPGSYLDTLFSAGWSCGECGGNDLLRYRAAQSAGAPAVQLRATASTMFYYHPNF